MRFLRTLLLKDLHIFPIDRPYIFLIKALIFVSVKCELAARRVVPCTEMPLLLQITSCLPSFLQQKFVVVISAKLLEHGLCGSRVVLAALETTLVEVPAFEALRAEAILF